MAKKPTPKPAPGFPVATRGEQVQVITDNTAALFERAGWSVEYAEPAEDVPADAPASEDVPADSDGSDSDTAGDTNPASADE